MGLRVRYVHRKIRADDVFDGALELLLQGVGRAPADENVIRNFGVIEPMEGNGVSKAPRDDRVEKGKARLVDIGRGDVSMGKGASRVRRLATRYADGLPAQLRGASFGFVV